MPTEGGISDGEAANQIKYKHMFIHTYTCSYLKAIATAASLDFGAKWIQFNPHGPKLNRFGNKLWPKIQFNPHGPPLGPFKVPPLEPTRVPPGPQWIPKWISWWISWWISGLNSYGFVSVILNQPWSIINAFKNSLEIHGENHCEIHSKIHLEIHSEIHLETGPPKKHVMRIR